MRQPLSPDYSKTYFGGGSRRSSKKSIGSRKSSISRKSSNASNRSHRSSRKNSRRSSTSKKSSIGRKSNSRRSSVSKKSKTSRKSSRRDSHDASRRSSYQRRSLSQRRSSTQNRRRSSVRKQSGSRPGSRKNSGRRESHEPISESYETRPQRERYSRERRASGGGSRRSSTADKRSRRSSKAGSGGGSRRSSDSKGNKFQKLSIADLAEKIHDGSKSPWGSRRESLKRIVDSKTKFYQDRERKMIEENLPVAQRKKASRKRPQKEVFRNPKPRKKYDNVCGNCQLKMARNQCVYTTRKKVCQNCNSHKAPKMMYLVKRAIAGRLYGANVKEMAHYIRCRYQNQVSNQGLQIRIKCALTRMMALHYIQKNPKDFGRFILTPQGRRMKLEAPKQPKLSTNFYKDLRKEKWRAKHRFLRQHSG